MSQLSRLISILTLLKSKRLLTATELSQRFNVSVRTIYRDIRKLEEAGVPVTTLEGRGYSLMEGYTVAPVQFTEKQANALITAQHLVTQTNDVSFIEDLKTPSLKLNRFLELRFRKKVNCWIGIFTFSIIPLKTYQAMLFQKFSWQLLILIMLRLIIVK